MWGIPASDQRIRRVRLVGCPKFSDVTSDTGRGVCVRSGVRRLVGVRSCDGRSGVVVGGASVAAEPDPERSSLTLPQVVPEKTQVVGRELVEVTLDRLLRHAAEQRRPPIQRAGDAFVKSVLLADVVDERGLACVDSAVFKKARKPPRCHVERLAGHARSVLQPSAFARRSSRCSGTRA